MNGERHELDVPVDASLADALRDGIGLTGTKVACNEGHCGAYTKIEEAIRTWHG